MSRWLRMSSAVSGSSRISSRGLATSASAIAMRWRCPPDSCDSLRAANSAASTAARISSTRRLCSAVGAAETPTVAGQSEQHRIACADRVARRGGVVLRHVADQPGGRTRWPAEHPDLTGRGGDHPEHRVQQRGLARAARSDDGEDPARRHVERALRPDQPAAPDDADVVEGQRRRRRARPRRQPTDTERLGEGGQLVHLPSLERFRARRHRFGHLRPPGRPRLRRRCGSARAPNPRSGCCRSTRRRPFALSSSRNASRSAGDGSVSLLEAVWYPAGVLFCRPTAAAM